MKTISFFILLLITNIFFAQTISKKEEALLPEISLNILDTQNSDDSMKIDSLLYDEIPKYLDFRGTVVEALKWKDIHGENILVLSKSGGFDWIEHNESNAGEFQVQDRSEVFAYLYQKQTNQSKFQRKWRIYDFIDCFGVDMYAGFKEQSLTITDVDNDGITEITIPYVLICRGGMDPGIMKIIMYEADQKFALRGETAICIKQKVKYGGAHTVDAELMKNEVLRNFLKGRWQALKCE